MYFIVDLIYKRTYNTINTNVNILIILLITKGGCNNGQFKKG